MAFEDAIDLASVRIRDGRRGLVAHGEPDEIL
jgi:hypothetical protein